MEKAGIYVHIPFCKSKCPYCDFYSMKLQNGLDDTYADFVAEKIRSYREKPPVLADTLYFGGGTPSLIGAKNIIKIIDAAKEIWNFEEITVECNPSAVEEDFFFKISQAGVNRISLGLQSAVDTERRSLGRLAGVREAEKCIRSAQNSGINNISLDVMIGVPDQTESTLDETLKFCTESGAKHISAYMLKLEEGTYFYKNQQKLNLPDDDFTADAYLRMVDFLEDAGFPQYEISNFAHKGFESRHNTKYWKCGEYLGIGPAAHSYLNGRRFYYPRDIEYFMNSGEPIDDGAGGDVKEFIMLGLRLRDGISFNELENRGFGYLNRTLKKEVSIYAEHGLMNINDERFSLTPSGFLLSNTIIAKILSFF